ncbi:MAG: DNA-3-methyladenine glycosylase 2 family protein [Parvularculaceae bacterium]
MAAQTKTRFARIDVFDDVSGPCAALALRDRALKTALDAIGKPHIRRRDGGFAGLFRIIVEQQVSVPSAQAIWARCQARFDPLEPAFIVETGEAALRAAGLSTPKARYVFALASSLASGAFSLATPDLDDAAASEALQSVKGVGPWTAAIYLLFCEGRPDVWPPGDVALQYAYAAAQGREGKIDAAKLDAKAAKWGPWRGLAAHILWTYYAHLKGRTPI